jgi:hypothetical protein
MSNNTLGHRIKPAVQTGLTAMGSTQTTALALTNNTLHEFTSVPSSAGAILPVGVTPSTISVFNDGANSLSIYPPTGGSIDGAAANASVALAAGSGATFWASTPSNWYHLVSVSAGGGTPGGSAGQIQYDNAGAFGGFTASGDATINTSTGAVTVTKTNGTPFAPSATIDTTNASNITSGSLALTELAAIAAHNVLANTTGGAASPAGVTFTSLLDGALGSTQGDVLFRGASSWGVLAPGQSTQFLQSGGPSANPSWGTPSVGGGTPGGTSGQIQYDNAGAFGGFTASGDATINTSTGAVTVTKTNGTSFAPSATTDTTNAANIASGTLPAAQLPALTGAVVTTAGSVATTFGTIPTLEVLANTTGGTAAPAGVTLSGLIDAAIGSTEGDLLYRGASLWSTLAPGANYNALQSGGAAAIPSWNVNFGLPSAGPGRQCVGQFYKVIGAATPVTSASALTSIFTGATAGGTLTLPAGALIAGQAIRLWLCGTFGCTASTPTLTYSLYFGATQLSTPPCTLTATATANGFWTTFYTPLHIFIQTIGYTGTCFCIGGIAHIDLTGSSLGNALFYNNEAAGNLNGSPITINTTISSLIDVRAQWGTANAANTLTLSAGYAELVG